MAGVPVADVLVEGLGPPEHGGHIRYLARIPPTEVAIEGIGTEEHSCHIGHLACIPPIEVAIENSGIGEHPLHIAHTGDVGDVCGVDCRQVGTAFKGAVHRNPIAGAPLFNGEQFVLVTTVIEVDLREAGACAGVVFDANGVGSSGGVITGGVICRACDVVCTVVVAVHVVVIAASDGGDGELCI